ncbi:MAG: SDR family NAD(P)-dependent oxidoreductase [Bacteroidetes bacterium]|nr:SDR family NAD(P)-dependent oxidoreductase [Bacteroidota bacterium]
MAKIAVVTGGSSGLGLCLAELLGNQEYKIIILARNQERIDKAIDGLKAKNIQASGISCDITIESQVREAAAKVKAEYGQVDFLVVNAGEVTTKLLVDYETIPELKKDLEVDLWGSIQTSYFFTPLLVEGSKVLFVSSGFGLIGGAGYSIYCAAKAGVVNFAESLRRELLCKKIGVYVACPGDMDTPQFHNEVKGQPQWMKQDSPRKVMPVEKAAKQILAKCKGTSRFMIITGSDVKLLAIVGKLLPRRWKDGLLDGMLPRPK